MALNIDIFDDESRMVATQAAIEEAHISAVIDAEPTIHGEGAQAVYLLNNGQTIISIDVIPPLPNGWILENLFIDEKVTKPAFINPDSVMFTKKFINDTGDSDFDGGLKIYQLLHGEVLSSSIY